jgi:serine/threonine-protein kinase SRK2
LLVSLFPGEEEYRMVPTVKLIDFGWSKNEHVDSTPNSVAGTAYYMAPEVYDVQRNVKERYDGQPVDIWTCGVLLLILLQGRYPFEPNSGNKDAALQEGVRLASLGALQPRLVHLAEALQPHASLACIQALRQMFALNAVDRPSAANLLLAPWLQHTVIPGNAVGLPPGVVRSADDVESVIQEMLEGTRTS